MSLPSFPDLEVKAKYATEHRCGIVISGPGLSDEVSGTDPLKDNLPLQVRCRCCFTHDSAALVFISELSSNQQVDDFCMYCIATQNDCVVALC